jgi:hypothetical protein
MLFGIVSISHANLIKKQNWVRGGRIQLYKKIYRHQNPREYEFSIDINHLVGFTSIFLGLGLFIIAFFI